MKEYVKDPDEFKKLIKGQIRWVIDQDPVYITQPNGSGKMQSGEVRLILSFSAISKDKNPQRIVAFRIDCGLAHRYSEDYPEKIVKIRAEAVEMFPKSKQGAFE